MNQARYTPIQPGQRPEAVFAFVMRKLGETKRHWRQISQDSSVPYGTLTKIAHGASPNPCVHTIQTLADYFGYTGAPAPAAAP